MMTTEEQLDELIKSIDIALKDYGTPNYSLNQTHLLRMKEMLWQCKELHT